MANFVEFPLEGDRDRVVVCVLQIGAQDVETLHCNVSLPNG